MNDLIEALTILNKYADKDCRWPTCCCHDELLVHAGIDVDRVSKEDLDRLEELGFHVSSESECFSSFRFGSC